MSRYRRSKKSSAIASLAMAGAFAASLLAAAPSANATFVLGTGNIGGLGDNVIVNACDSVATGPGALVQGCLNTAHDTNVDVSTTSGNLEANGGQARFDASGGNISDFTINFEDLTLGFSGIVFNINAENGTNSDVTIVVNAVNELGEIEEPQEFNGTIDQGENFFNLTSVDGEVALNITVTSSEGNIVDIRQVRIAAETIPQPPIQAPEPASLAMLGGALIGFALLRRRKRA
jgi:hypothetical protein